MFFTSNKMITGIDIGHFAIKYVSLLNKRESIELIKAGYEEIEHYSEDSNINIKKTIENLSQKINTNKGKIVSSVDNENLIVKKMCLPLMDREAVIETIRWEFSEYVPFSVEESVIDYVITSENDEEVEISAVIVPRVSVNNSLQFLKRFKITSLNIQPFALLNIFKNKGINHPIMIVDLGHGSIQIIVGNEDNIYLMRNLKFGMEDIHKNIITHHKNLAIVRENTQMSYNTGNLDQNNFFKELKKEINRAVNFFNNNNNKAIEEIYLSGGGVYLDDIKKKLGKKINVELKFINPFTDLVWSHEQVENTYLNNGGMSEYSVATGLCISEVLSDES